MRHLIILLTIFVISEISCVNPVILDKNVISIKVQSVLNQPTVYINNISESYFPQISLYLDGVMLSNFDKKVPVSDGKIHKIVLIFPKFFKGSCIRMFYGIENVKEISFINFKGCKDTREMFFGMSNLTSLDLDQFDTSLVVDMKGMFAGCTSLTSLDLRNINSSLVRDMSSMFASLPSLLYIQNLNKLNTSRVFDMPFLFEGCVKLKSIDLSGFNTTLVENMYSMFSNCISLVSLDLSKFDTRNVNAMNKMFNNCSSLTFLNLSSFNTSRVKTMHSMFFNCTSLTSLDVSSFNTENVYYMEYMFAHCSLQFNQN